MPFKKKSEATFCERDRYTKSAKATSFIQCKQSIKTAIFSEKLTNIKRLNHVALVEETGGIDLYLWQAVRTIVFNFTTLFQLCQPFYQPGLTQRFIKHIHIYLH